MPQHRENNLSELITPPVEEILAEHIADQLAITIADAIVAQIDLATEATAKRPAGDELPLESIEI